MVNKARKALYKCSQLKQAFYDACMASRSDLIGELACTWFLDWTDTSVTTNLLKRAVSPFTRYKPFKYIWMNSNTDFFCFSFFFLDLIKTYWLTRWQNNKRTNTVLNRTCTINLIILSSVKRHNRWKYAVHSATGVRKYQFVAPHLIKHSSFCLLMKLNSEAACFQVYSLGIKIFAFTKLIEVRLQKEKKSSCRFLPEGLQKLQKGIFLK